MPIFATSGSELAIGGVLASKSTPFGVSDFAGQSWTDVAWLENLGEFGDEATEITFESIDQGRVQKLKGTRNAGNMEVVCGLDYSDAGQSALRDAEAEIHDYAFRVTFDDAPSGGTASIRYFIAKVMTARERPETANNVVRFAATLGINSNIVVVDATAP